MGLGTAWLMPLAVILTVCLVSLFLCFESDTVVGELVPIRNYLGKGKGGEDTATCG